MHQKHNRITATTSTTEILPVNSDLSKTLPFVPTFGYTYRLIEYPAQPSLNSQPAIQIFNSIQDLSTNTKDTLRICLLSPTHSFYLSLSKCLSDLQLFYLLHSSHSNICFYTTPRVILRRWTLIFNPILELIYPVKDTTEFAAEIRYFDLLTWQFVYVLLAVVALSVPCMQTVQFAARCQLTMLSVCVDEIRGRSTSKWPDIVLGLCLRVTPTSKPSRSLGDDDSIEASRQVSPAESSIRLTWTVLYTRERYTESTHQERPSRPTKRDRADQKLGIFLFTLRTR